MDDLFAPSEEWLSVPMPNASVKYLEKIPTISPPDKILNELIDTVSWREEEVLIYGKRHLQPRLVAWFGDAGLDYSYSGIKLSPLPWTPILLELKSAVESVSDHKFNSVLLNYYRNERDSMGFHSDDEIELGKNPVIASLSFGEVRTLIFKSKNSKSIKSVRLPLMSGSLLLMQGDTQSNWLHGIDKEKNPCGPRVNLTFRMIQLVPREGW